MRQTIDKIQHVTQPPDAQKNFLVVDAKTENSAIEAAFDRFTNERKDIAILLINQHVRGIQNEPSKTCCRYDNSQFEIMWQMLMVTRLLRK